MNSPNTKEIASANIIMNRFVNVIKSYGCGAFVRFLNSVNSPSVVKETCQYSPIYPPEMLELIAVSQDMSPYPDEWSSPDEIAIMLEVGEEMF